MDYALASISGTGGAPSMPMSSGQMRYQSAGRKSQRLTDKYVAASIATHSIGLGSRSFCLADNWERYTGVTPMAAASLATPPWGRSSVKVFRSIEGMHFAQQMPKHSAQLQVMQAAYASGVTISSRRHANRRARLAQLVQEAGGGTALAVKVGTPKSHISAIQAGARGIGDALAAKLERKCEKPEGWMDLPVEAAQAEHKPPRFFHVIRLCKVLALWLCNVHTLSHRVRRRS